MANTYYDSRLDDEEIEAALEAISGLIVPANNGKVIAINNGKFEARSVQWGGGTPTIESLSVTANGTYTAPSGVDGYSPVTVNVSGGGGATFSEYTPTWRSSYPGVTSADGKIISDGRFASLLSKVVLDSSTNYETDICTVPADVIPCGYFPCVQPTNGSSSGNFWGVVQPNGKIHIRANGLTSFYLQCNWPIPGTEYDLLYDSTYVTSADGKISVKDGFATMGIKISLTGAGNTWRNGIFTIPSSIKPASQTAFMVRQNTQFDSAVLDTTYNVETGSIDLFIKTGVSTVYLYGQWLVGS